MSIKKMLLLVVMALAAVAFAVPSTAQADPKWFVEDPEAVEVPENVKKEVHLTGDLEMIFPSTGFRVEACEYTFFGFAVNENAMASGTVDAETRTELCSTSVPGCAATLTFEGLPWEMTGTTSGENSMLEIKGLTITAHFGKACQLAGMPATVSIAGSITGQLCMAECLVFDTHADKLKLEAPLPELSVDVSGTLTISHLLTLH